MTEPQPSNAPSAKTDVLRKHLSEFAADLDPFEAQRRINLLLADLFPSRTPEAGAARDEEAGCREGCKPGGACRWVGCKHLALDTVHEEWGVWPDGYTEPVIHLVAAEAEADQFADHYDWVDGNTPPELVHRQVSTGPTLVTAWRRYTPTTEAPAE